MGETRVQLTDDQHGDTVLVLNDQLFRRKTDAMGARNDRERCAIAGISRASLHRWRRGSVVPSLVTLRGVAKRLDVEHSQLVREVTR